jgi:hypothetical protein
MVDLGTNMQISPVTTSFGAESNGVVHITPVAVTGEIAHLSVSARLFLDFCDVGTGLTQ